MTKTWLITGVSGGLGREVALAALARGDLVFGTVRKAKDADAFELLGGHALVLDVTDEAAVKEGVFQAARTALIPVFPYPDPAPAASGPVDLGSEL